MRENDGALEAFGLDDVEYRRGVQELVGRAVEAPFQILFPDCRVFGGTGDIGDLLLLGERRQRGHKNARYCARDGQNAWVLGQLGETGRAFRLIITVVLHN